MKRTTAAFTLTEILVTMGIAAIVLAGVILAMSRGASNVQKGSFSVHAGNQIAWIAMWLRRDLSQCRLDTMKMGTGNKKWDGTSGKLEFFLLPAKRGKATYELVTHGKGKALIRTAQGKVTVLAREILHKLEIHRLNEADFRVLVELKDPAKRAKDITWEGNIYSPGPDIMAQFWKK